MKSTRSQPPAWLLSKTLVNVDGHRTVLQQLKLAIATKKYHCFLLLKDFHFYWRAGGGKRKIEQPKIPHRLQNVQCLFSGTQLHLGELWPLLGKLIVVLAMKWETQGCVSPELGAGCQGAPGWLILALSSLHRMNDITER